jgi:uncharacterized repeat protein (TIGR03806 family)
MGVLLLGWWTAALPLAGQEVFFRTDQRLPWTSSRIQGTPDPPDPYRLEVAYPQLTFAEPIDLALIPRLGRFAVVEHRRGISTFPVGSTDEQPQPLYVASGADTELFAVAFHPRFVDNGWVFFTYADQSAVYLARLTCSFSDGVPRAASESMQVVFTWPTGGHTGGCVRFGPDGYLYLATGDGSGHSDTNQYAQDIRDVRGAILRLDVDHPEDGRLYRIPPDNPFVDHPGARGEIYAYGLRQPWKFSFDPEGRLWAGEVGQDLWEMVHLIVRGGNYGWSITEGTHPFRPERVRGPTAIVPPVIEHDHNEFRSLTGGYVYGSSRLEELRGAYIYGDFDTGRIWMLRYEDGQVTESRQLTASGRRVVGFAQDDAGEVYVAGYASGRIFRLERNEAAGQQQADFPRRLSETGLFASTKQHLPATGMIPYSINAPMYADGAVVERYLGLPGDARMEFDALLYPRGPGAPPGWRFPDGTVLVQTFSMPLDTADPHSLRRLETRILHHRRMPGSDDDYGAQIWHGYTYIWNEDQTDAVLADAAGQDLILTIHDRESGQDRQQTWHVSGRTECSVCHNIAGKHVLGVNTLQMNREHDYGPVTENQLMVFDRLGLFMQPLPEPPAALPRLADYHDDSESLDERARSYLHANCSHCHRQWGGGNASFQLMATLPIDETGALDAVPTHGNFGISEARVISPGDPYRSVLLYRMASVGFARMPRLGASTVDPLGLHVVDRWIAGMRVHDAARAVELPEDLRQNEPSPSSTAVIDAWLADTSKSLRLIAAIDNGQVPVALRQLVIDRAKQMAEPQVLDLFERYLPESQRTKRLGAVVNADVILSLAADAQRGEALFFRSTTLQCRNCHQINGQGKQVGPDLSHIGKDYDGYRLLDSIANPSREVKPEYTVYVVETQDGRVFNGIRVPGNDDEIVLKNANGDETRILAGAVHAIQPQQASLMPESLVQAMTAQQLADLIAYLRQLK